MDNKQLHCAVIAPAGPPSQSILEKGLKLLEENSIDSTVMPGVFHNTSLCRSDDQRSDTPNYLSNSIENRISDFREAVRNNDYDFIWCARGGYGSAQLLPHIDWNSLPQTSKPLLGYSDITTLHLASIKHGICTPIQAPMICDITKKDQASLKQLFSLLQQKELPGETQLTPLTNTEREITGKVVGGTLSVIASMCGTPHLPSFENSILFIEDIGEAPYKLDRYLTQLLQSCTLKGLNAVVCGTFTDCGEKNEIKEAAQHSLSGSGIPVFWGFPFGHGEAFTPLVLGSKARITEKSVLQFMN